MTQLNNLLLVDDDLTFLNILQQAFKYRDITTEQAQTPEQAVQLMQQKAFEYAVVDLNIDGQSGLNLLSELLSLQPDCKILILTGYASVATAVEAMRLGAVNYLCKPANIDDIIQAFSPQADHQASPPSTEQEETFQAMSVKRLEWEHIQKVLMENDGNISATAQALNMHRRTLQRKLQKRPVDK
ncbi:response regulator transcription factor [Thiomicrorhabdus xiamenensis]|uniref:Response regulator n=1 Tax=Thiomicrorhabdus xiamenensis TaxID=2739063 RepID=A0A7D4SJK1_9GAMM|nr:response regulator [Thiomicrorhabdus xiamenensis]QKI90119.1 response regulator [Thiomicrorhabdus xiamenensis]